MVRRNRGEDLRPLEEEAQFTTDTTAGDLLKPLGLQRLRLALE